MDGNRYYLKMRGIVGEAIVGDNVITVLAGSGFYPESAKHISPKIAKQREQAQVDGTVVNGRLTRDIEFKSASSAAVFLLGFNTNGKQSWRDSSGLPLSGHKKIGDGIDPRTGEQEFGAFFATVGGNEGTKCHYPTRLDTYGCGCAHNCKYCYARSLQSFRDQWDPARPKVANISRIERKLKKLPKDTVLRLGGLTDCFQPCEKKLRTTYETLKLLNKYNIQYLIVTKSDLVAEDEYINIMRKDLAHIQISVTTTDDIKSLTYEGAPVPSRRIAAIEKLYDAGFDVAFRLSPYIDGFVDFDKISHLHCDKMLVEFLRIDGKIKQWFDIDTKDYVLSQSGCQHLSLPKKLEMLSKIRGFKEITVCDDYTEHYEYFRDNYNPNPNDCCNLRFSNKED